MQKITKEEVQQRFDRLTEIFAGIVTQADAQATLRCPYRDRHDRCTAKFRCRNQASPEAGGQVLICTHDGAFDYRQAWESDPRAVDTARRKVGRIRHEAEGRRAGDGGASGDGRGDQ